MDVCTLCVHVLFQYSGQISLCRIVKACEIFSLGKREHSQLFGLYPHATKQAEVRGRSRGEACKYSWDLCGLAAGDLEK